MQDMNNHNMGVSVNVSVHLWLTKRCISLFLHFQNSQISWEEIIETSVLLFQDLIMT